MDEAWCLVRTDQEPMFGPRVYASWHPVDHLKDQQCQRSLASPPLTIEGARQRKESKRKAASQAVDDGIAEVGAAKRARQRANWAMDLMRLKC